MDSFIFDRAKIEMFFKNHKKVSNLLDETIVMGYTYRQGADYETYRTKRVYRMA